MAASGSGGMKGGIRRLKARAVAVNVTTPAVPCVARPGALLFASLAMAQV
jgi:hypothetical protein